MEVYFCGWIDDSVVIWEGFVCEEIRNCGLWLIFCGWIVRRFIGDGSCGVL